MRITTTFVCISVVALLTSISQAKDDQERVLAQSKCTQGDAKACFDIGERLFKGYGGARDPALAQEYLRKACEFGSSSGCYHAGLFFWNPHENDNSVIGLEEDASKALEYYKKACDGNHYHSCYMVGLLWTNGIAGYDEVQALSFYKKGCDGSDPFACGAKYKAQGTATDEDAEYYQHLRLHQRSCDNWDGDSCLWLGMVELLVTDRPRDESAVRRYVPMACANGSARGCHVAASLTQNGIVVGPKNLEKAASFYIREREILAWECDLGILQQCILLADRTETNWMPGNFQGTSPDPSLVAKEKVLLEKACDAGDADSCYTLAYAFPGDLAKVIALLEKACDGGDADGCFSLAQTWGGSTEESDFEEASDSIKSKHYYRIARDKYQKECDLGNKTSCCKLVPMLEHGDGGKRDVKKAKEIDKKFCPTKSDTKMEIECLDKGNVDSCVKLYFFRATTASL